MALPAHAQQLIDRIDVQEAGAGRAEIVIRFTTNVVYQRHTPGAGRMLRIFFRLGGIEGAVQPRDREFRIAEPSALLPRFTVSYPESDTSMLLTFGTDTTFVARQGPDARSLSVLLPSQLTPAASMPQPAQAAPQAPPAVPREGQPPAASEPRPTFEPVPLARVEEVAADLIGKARTALERNDPATAIGFLNNLLDLPANAQSANAQELIGQARERSGEPAKARAEYEVYLRLYPEGEGVARVRQRLALLSAAQALAATAPPVPQGGQGTPWQISGGISQNYYSGKSRIEILTPPPPGFLAFTQQNLTTTDQNALITNLDVNARKRSDTGVDHRLVFRDTYTSNFLPNQRDTERLSSAYYEITDRATGYQARVGRQSGTFAVIGQFDGLYAGYQIAPDIRINAVAGQPVQYTASTSPFFQILHGFNRSKELAPALPLPYSRNFWAANLEYQAKPEQIGGNVYFVEQYAEGFLDRQAIGMELRYFDARKSGFALLDYDTINRGINIATVQGNMQFGEATSVYALADHRKSPMLALTGALSAATSPTTSLPAANVTEALLNTGLSISDLRAWARDLAAESNFASVGATHRLTERWQIGGDANVSRLSNTRGAGTTPATPGAQPTRSYSAQLIGNSVVFANDSAVANLNMVEAPTLKARNLSLNHVSTWMSKLRFDVALRFYDQVDNQGTTLKRFSPTLRINYRWLNNLSFEAEGGMENSKQQDVNGGTTTSDRQYFYMGYRWDFQ